MEKLRGVWFWMVLLSAGLNAALAQDETAYFVVGGKLELRPSVSDRINNLLWKHNGNLVAEWVENKLDKVYGNFQNRANMDKTTGLLEITGMTEADSGSYTVEINKKDQGLRYNAVAIREVPKPLAVVKPLTCSLTSAKCSLHCEGETEGAEPVSYSLKKGDGKWEESTKVMDITKAETAHVEKLSCRMKNPVSEKESEPVDNPLFEEKGPDEPGNGIGTVVGIVIAVLLVLGAASGVGYWKRDAIMKFLGRGDNRGDNVEMGGGGDVNSATGNGAKSPDEKTAMISPKPGTENTEGGGNSAVGDVAQPPPPVSKPGDLPPGENEKP